MRAIPDPLTSDLTFLVDRQKAANFQKQCEIYGKCVQAVIAILEDHIAKVDECINKTETQLKFIQRKLNMENAKWPRCALSVTTLEWEKAETPILKEKLTRASNSSCVSLVVILTCTEFSKGLISSLNTSTGDFVSSFAWLSTTSLAAAVIFSCSDSVSLSNVLTYFFCAMAAFAISIAFAFSSPNLPTNAAVRVRYGVSLFCPGHFLSTYFFQVSSA